MIADFRRLGHPHSHRAIKIHDEMVEIVHLVHLYKYLRMIFEDTWKWDLNTEVTTKKGHQWFHQLRNLRSFNIDPAVQAVLQLFYLECFDLFFHLLVL